MVGWMATGAVEVEGWSKDLMGGWRAVGLPSGAKWRGEERRVEESGGFQSEKYWR